VTAIVGGLGAAILWAGATLASSRSSRMLGSRVILAWIMVVGIVIGLPIGLASGVPAEITPASSALLLVAGLCYAGGLYAAYTALTVGKVGIVAPIVATEGAVAAVIAVALGVVLSSIEPARPDVIAGDFEIAADAIDGPPPLPEPVAIAIEVPAATAPSHVEDTRRAALLAVLAAAIFGVGLVATGKAAVDVPPIWVAISTRMVGLVVVVLPLLVQRRMVLTRAALPLVLIAGTGEIIGSTLSAWGSSVNIAITAVLGSQFAAIAAVLAFLLFGERLSRTQVLGVIFIVAGVSALAATSL
jgi:drug/metabolite transporter (DMT)-like permease